MNCNGFILPDDYVNYVSKLIEYEIFYESRYIHFFPLKELETINEEYEVELYVPNYLVIASNGSGVGVFYNKSNCQIYTIPFIGMDEDDAILLAANFTVFIEKFKTGEIEII